MRWRPRELLALLFAASLPAAPGSPAEAAPPDALPSYELYLEGEPLQRLEAHRERIQGFATLAEEDRLWVPARFRCEGEDYDVRLRLRGDLPAHWRGDKQSFRVKFRKRLFRGWKEMNLIVPWDKHYAVEWLQTRIAEELGLQFFPGRFVNVTINGRDKGLYYENEHPTRQYLERNGRMPSSIFTFGAHWTLYFGKAYHHIVFELPGSLTKPPLEGIAQIKQRATYDAGDREYARKQLAYLLEFYLLLTEGSPEDVAQRAGYFLDLEKFARFVALQDFFGTTHAMALNDNTRLYLDPSSGKFEFMPWDTALRSLRARSEEAEGEALLTPEDPVFRRLFEAIPGLREYRDDVLRGLLVGGEGYRAQLERRHAELLRLYPGDERLRRQRALHDAVFRENLALLERILSSPQGRASGEVLAH